MLHAAHIVRWAVYPDARGKTNNIICMCIIHHSPFDGHKLTILDDYTVEFSKPFLEAYKYSTYNDQRIINTKKRKIT
ncbi:MAG: HNH endonuclease, partial [Nitrososphaeraceae archaeon]